METRAPNGSHHHAEAVPTGAQRPSDVVRDGATGLAQPRSAVLPEAAAKQYRALARSQQRLATAREQIEALLAQNLLLKQKMIQFAQAVAQARQFAHHDELTGLPNRNLLLDRFNQAVARAARQHKQVALLFLDLDGFKRINDTRGHTTGDRVLQQVAARLTACIRASDTACRYGGDEFVILLPEFEGQESAVAVAEKIRAHLATPYVVDGAVIRLSTSIGMAVYPVDGNEYGDLIHVSDLAMYRHKARGPAAPHVLDTGTPPTVPGA
jgi:diguanylate cyclase (GGDEF)-like protein